MSNLALSHNPRPYRCDHALLCLMALAAFLNYSSFARADEPGLFTFGLGIYDIVDEETTGEFRFEYVFSHENKILLFDPFIGFSGTVEGATYAYGGIGLDVFCGKRWVGTPNFAVGIYGDGDGKDLGSALEFKSGFSLAYRFDDHSRLGIAFHHISNAGLGNRNPGEESLLLVYSWPLTLLFDQ